MNEDYVKRVKDIISRIIYINLATVKENNTPWNSPLFSVHDENYNFYWISNERAQHSLNILKNNNVFITIYDSTAPEGKGEGVYIEAKVRELSNDEAESAVGKVEDLQKVKEYLKVSGIKLYKAETKKIWFVPQEVDERIEINLG